MYSLKFVRTDGEEVTYALPRLDKWPKEIDFYPNFVPGEFVCKDGSKFFTIDQKLIDGLQALRSKTQSPVHILSAYRTPSHNRAVKGAKNSQHLYGRAADIIIYNFTVTQIYNVAEYIKEFKIGGIIKYPTKGFVHLDVRDDGPYRATK